MTRRVLVPEDLRSGNAHSLFRATLASALATVDRQRGDPETITKAKWPDDRLAAVLAKSATSPAMTSVPAWAGALVQSAVADFLIALGPHSAASEIIQASLSLTFDRAGKIVLPTFVADFANAGFVAEGQPIPVHNLNVSGADPLMPHKAAAIALLSREMVESSNAEELIGDTLRRAAGRMLDEVMFDANPAADNRPAGLRKGIAATTPSAATDAEAAFIEDCGKLADAVSPVAGNSELIFIGSPGRALKAELHVPRDIPRMRVLGSNAVINDWLVIASNALVTAIGTSPRIETSKSTVIQSDTTPAPDLPAGHEVSLWQVDAVALKLTWPVSWALRDVRGFAWCTPTGW